MTAWHIRICQRSNYHHRSYSVPRSPPPPPSPQSKPPITTTTTLITTHSQQHHDEQTNRPTQNSAWDHVQSSHEFNIQESILFTYFKSRIHVCSNCWLYIVYDSLFLLLSYGLQLPNKCCTLSHIFSSMDLQLKYPDLLEAAAGGVVLTIFGPPIWFSSSCERALTIANRSKQKGGFSWDRPCPSSGNFNPHMFLMLFLGMILQREDEQGLAYWISTSAPLNLYK